jgi:hypothetical protein
MKKFLVASFCICYLLSASQKLKEGDVPTAVRDAFKKLHPGISVTTWQKVKYDFYEAAYKQDNKDVIATFKGNGLLQRTKEEAGPGKVPDKIKNHAESLYPGFDITGFSMIRTPDKKLFYEVEMKKAGEEKSLIYNDNNDYLREEFFEDKDAQKSKP